MDSHVKTEDIDVKGLQEEHIEGIRVDDSGISSLKTDFVAEFNDIILKQNLEPKSGSSRSPDEVAVCSSEQEIINVNLNEDSTGFPEMNNEGEESLDNRAPIPIEHIELVPEWISTDRKDYLDELSFSINTEDSYSVNCTVDPLEVETGNEDELKNSTCPTCYKVFSCPSALKNHMLIHAGAEPYMCSYCPKTFLSLRNLKTHTFSHTKEKPFSCKVCNKSFSQESTLNNHVYIHSSEKLFSCKVCQVKFAQPSSLRRHMKIHPGETPLSCTICTEKFWWHTHLKKHMRTHTTGKKRYKCSVCSLDFGSSSNLKSHMFRHTGEKPFKCTFCPKSFTAKASLKLHSYSHTLESEFSCIYCEKKFISPIELKYHVKSHINAAAFTCKICHKKFSRPMHVKVHMLQHTRGSNQEAHQLGRKERPSIRTRKNSHSNSLKLHTKLKHTGENKVISCTVCEQMVSSSNLKRHMLTHKKPNTVSKKPSTLSSDLTNHSRNKHTDINRFPCTVCAKDFPSLFSLWSHMWKHNSEENRVGRENHTSKASSTARDTDKNSTGEETPTGNVNAIIIENSITKGTPFVDESTNRIYCFERSPVIRYAVCRKPFTPSYGLVSDVLTPFREETPIKKENPFSKEILTIEKDPTSSIDPLNSKENPIIKRDRTSSAVVLNIPEDTLSHRFRLPKMQSPSPITIDITTSEELPTIKQEPTSGEIYVTRSAVIRYAVKQSF